MIFRIFLTAPRTKRALLHIILTYTVGYRTMFSKMQCRSTKRTDWEAEPVFVNLLRYRFPNLAESIHGLLKCLQIRPQHYTVATSQILPWYDTGRHWIPCDNIYGKDLLCSAYADIDLSLVAKELTFVWSWSVCFMFASIASYGDTLPLCWVQRRN